MKKKGNEAYRLRLEATKEERAQYRKERYTKMLQEQKSYRLETTKKKVLRCVEFDYATALKRYNLIRHNPQEYL